MSRAFSVNADLLSTPNPLAGVVVLARLARAWRVLAATVCLAALPGLATPAAGQQNSDLRSEPKSLTTFDRFTEQGRNLRQLTFNRMPGLSADYHLGPGDELEITVVGMFEKAQVVAINTSGDIALPLLGSVHLQGLTAEEAEAAIATALKERNLIKEPEVLVFIASYQAKTVYALGELDRQGEYSVSFDMTLMDLVFVSGGLDFSAGRYGYLHRRAADGAHVWRPFQKGDFETLANRPDLPRPGNEVIEVDLQPMKEGGVLKTNPLLKDGDVFYVPARAVSLVYVIGDVVGAGAFELPAGQRLTAAQAIAWAGGPAKTARMSQGMLVRYENDGRRVEQDVDFAAILKGSKPDVEIRANDVIFIPGSQGKTLGMGMLGQIASLALFF